MFVLSSLNNEVSTKKKKLSQEYQAYRIEERILLGVSSIVGLNAFSNSKTHLLHTQRHC